MMLYANTLMTVAIICHVRKHRVWLRPVRELPKFSAPALTFAPPPDTEFDSPFLAKSNESLPILGGSTQLVDPRTLLQFRSRITFPPHPPARPGIVGSASSLLPLPSDSAASLLPTGATHTDVATPHNINSYPMGHHILTTGEPPTYSGPGSTQDLIAV